jgi:predicted site-specific integrase-resolvase
MSKSTDYLTTAEAAECLDIHPITTRKWAAGGKVPTYCNPVNGYRPFTRTDLDKLLEKVAEPVRATVAKKAR